MEFSVVLMGIHIDDMGLFIHILIPGNDMTVSQTLLTQRGIPVLSLSNGKAYCFNPALSTW